jgi:hypothetical protein
MVNALMAVVPMRMVLKQVGHKRLSTTISASMAPALVKEAYEMRSFGPVRSVRS